MRIVNTSDAAYMPNEERINPNNDESERICYDQPQRKKIVDELCMIDFANNYMVHEISHHALVTRPSLPKAKPLRPSSALATHEAAHA